MTQSQQCRVAVIQAAPVLFDKQATIARACELIAEAAGQGAELLLFPEAFVPAYPRGLSFGMAVGSRSEAGRDTWKRYWDNAIDLPGPETETLGQAARAHGVTVAIGVIERDRTHGGGTLYCTLLYIGPDGHGRLLAKHRKLKPTGSERLIWGEGDGSTLATIELPFGTVGGLICWENYMPLARMAMYARGVHIYLAPTADQRDSWQATVRHIACEGRCYVLGCNQFVTKSMYPADLPGIDQLAGQPDIMCRGGSVIVSPMGEVLAGPLWNREGILHATLERSAIDKAKLDFDVVGHYARPDVFQLHVNERPMTSVKSSE